MIIQQLLMHHNMDGIFTMAPNV